MALNVLRALSSLYFESLIDESKKESEKIYTYT